MNRVDEHLQVFVGRVRESKQLGKLFSESVEQGARMVLVGGDTGTGKTSLLQLLKGNVEARHGYYLVCKSGPLGSSYPYHPLAELLRILLEHFGKNRVQEIVKGYSPRVLTELSLLIPKFSELCNPMGKSLSFTETLPDKLFLENVCSIAGDLLGSTPVVLIIEDIPYADPTTLEVIQHFIQHAEKFRMLICGTYDLDDIDLANPKFTSFRNFVRSLNYEEALVKINLPPFNREETEEFVKSLLRESLLPTGLVDAVYQKSEGNPLVIRHLVGKLIAIGVLQMSDQGWHYSRPWEISLPEEIQEMFLLRLQGIKPELRSVLSTAAVIGRRFTAQNLTQVLNMSLMELLPLLEEAISLRLIEEHHDSIQGYFTFVSARLQEVLYESISYQRKIILHEEIGVLLEQTIDPRQSPDEFAYHFQWGADRYKAVKYAILAGQRALSLYAFHTAWRYFASARDLFPLLDPSALHQYKYAVLEGLAESANFLGYYSEARKCLGDLLGLGVEKGTALYASVQNKLGDLSFRMGNSKEALDHYNLALQSCRDQQKCHILNNIIQVYLEMGMLEEAETLAELQLVRAEASGNATVQLEIYAIITTYKLYTGEINVALNYAKKLPTSPTSNALSDLYLSIIKGRLALEHGPVDTANELLNLSLELAKKMQDPLMMGLAQISLARLYIVQGEWLKAKHLLERIKTQEVYANSKILRTNVCTLESYLAVRLQHEDKAAVLLVELQEADKNKNITAFSPQNLALRAELAVTCGRLDEAMELLNEAEKLIEVYPTPRNQIRVLRGRVILQQARPQTANAAQLVNLMFDMCQTNLMFAEGVQFCALLPFAITGKYQSIFYKKIGLAEPADAFGSQEPIKAELPLKDEEKSEANLPLEMIAVLDYIRREYASELTVAALCKVANLSERQLRRLFSHYVGVSIKEYINDFRIEQAKELLQNPTMGISEVGTLVGISDKSHFCKTFKAIVGVSPSQYRKEPLLSDRKRQQMAK